MTWAYFSETIVIAVILQFTAWMTVWAASAWNRALVRQLSNEARTSGSANPLSTHGNGPGRCCSFLADKSSTKHAGFPAARVSSSHTMTDQHQPCQRAPGLPITIRESCRRLTLSQQRPLRLATAGFSGIKNQRRLLSEDRSTPAELVLQTGSCKENKKLQGKVVVT